MSRSEPRGTTHPMVSPWGTITEVLKLIEQYGSKWTENYTAPEEPRPSRRLPK